MVGLGGLSLVLAMLFGSASSAGSPCGIGSVTNFVGEAGGLLGVRFWKQSDNWSMPLPAGFILLTEAFVCPMKCI